MFKTVLLVVLVSFCAFAEKESTQDRADSFLKEKQMVPQAATLSQFSQKNGMVTLKYESGTDSYDKFVLKDNGDDKFGVVFTEHFARISSGSVAQLPISSGLGPQLPFPSGLVPQLPFFSSFVPQRPLRRPSPISFLIPIVEFEGSNKEEETEKLSLDDIFRPSIKFSADISDILGGSEEQDNLILGGSEDLDHANRVPRMRDGHPIVGDEGEGAFSDDHPIIGDEGALSDDHPIIGDEGALSDDHPIVGDEGETVRLTPFSESDILSALIPGLLKAISNPLVSSSPSHSREPETIQQDSQSLKEE